MSLEMQCINFYFHQILLVQFKNLKWNTNKTSSACQQPDKKLKSSVIYTIGELIHGQNSLANPFSICLLLHSHFLLSS